MVELVLFYSIAILLVLLTLVVAFLQHPIRQILSLIGVFVLMSMLWLLIQAEFLALLLIFVYVGAVMTLFLYMVMMFNSERIKGSNYPFFWFAYIVYIVLTLAIVYGLKSILPHKPLPMGAFQGIGTQVKFTLNEMGRLLFIEYWLEFEVLGYILLVTMIASIHLVFRGHVKSNKRQKANDQITVTKQNRLRIVKGDN